MKTVRVTYQVGGEMIERTFRTNDSGNYLFVGESENNQLSCDSGYDDKRKMAKAIRDYAIWKASGGIVSRIKYEWKHF